MKSFTIIFSGFAVTLLLSSCANLQYKKGRQAQAYLEYSDAVRHYEKALRKKSIDSAYLGLAESYYWMNNSNKSVQWYDSAAEHLSLPPQHMLYYAEGLRHLERYDESRTWVDQYLANRPNDVRAKNFRTSLARIREMKSDSLAYSAMPAEGLDLGNRSAFSPTHYKDGMMITAEWGEDRSTQEYEWTGKPFLDLVYVQMDTNQRITGKRQFSDRINSKYHEGPAVFTADADTLYFSRNEMKEKRTRKNWNDNTSEIKLFRAVRDADEANEKDKEEDWEDIEEMDLNVEGYSTGHPALTRDGKTMYFVSDRPGGKGRADIWKVTKTSSGWSTPKNLTAINTEGNEMFPTVARDADGSETLVFSSDGHGGLGGLDLYTVPVNNERLPEHLGYPLNSSFDDFGLMTQTMDYGYFSTNRATEENETDQIYVFERRPEIPLLVTVENTDDDTPIAGAQIMLSSSEKTTISELETNRKGQVLTTIRHKNEYMVTAMKEGFVTSGTSVNTGDMNARVLEDTIEVTIGLSALNQLSQLDNMGEVDELQPREQVTPRSTVPVPAPTQKQTQTQTVVVNAIFYDYDKWNIRPDAARELDKLAKTLKQNPDMHLELASHADCRGTNEYNRELAKKRAKSAVAYLVDKGIEVERVTAIGFGERELANECDCHEDALGTSCTNGEHQRNRRTDFQVLQMGEEAKWDTATNGDNVDLSNLSDIDVL